MGRIEAVAVAQYGTNSDGTPPISHPLAHKLIYTHSEYVQIEDDAITSLFKRLSEFVGHSAKGAKNRRVCLRQIIHRVGGAATRGVGSDMVGGRNTK